MEGLRKQGLASLSQFKFFSAPDEHELITINRSESPARLSLPLHDIIDRFQEEDARSVPRPAIRLVKLHIRHPLLLKALDPPVLNAPREDIIRLWDHLHLEPTVFQLLTKGIQGYYQHHTVTTTTSHGSRVNRGKRIHYLFCSYVYCLIWNYCPQTQTTNAVMLLRPEEHLGRIDFDQWLSVLAMQTPLARHPLCLFIATIMQTMHVATAGAKGAQALINNIEWKTGFYPWVPVPRLRFPVRGVPVFWEEDMPPGGPVGGPEYDPMSKSSLQTPRLIPSNSTPSEMTLDELSIASRNIGAVLVMLEDHFRQLKQLQLAIDAFTSSTADLVSNSSTEKHEEEEEEMEESIRQALRLFTQQIESYNMRLHYLRERGRNQSTVVFNLLTRADTQASISLAKSAKKDSSSMKVIAVMTMAFLPATFLAALFAVPSLRWDDEAGKVMQDNFWVFWAFALPATGLVFGLWFLLTPGENSDVSLMAVLLSRIRDGVLWPTRNRKTVSSRGGNGRGGEGAGDQAPTTTTGTSTNTAAAAFHSEATTIRRLQNFILNRGGNLGGGDIDPERPIDLPDRHGVTGVP